ncbi:hypothetical protein [Stutzerimonas kirkiae]|uniref:hypothetical protein n=1 Tax=Stutzerimonas kirkiae TaxID=2211392 RepID=UPI0010384D55|nr:hypothetical protein [Stutzerimonas kirkiae]TBV12777.1 hypothetical protein DNK01_13920 [Stutzerimonas kirkiae]
MSIYAVCDITGWISLTARYPADGLFGLARGTAATLEAALLTTADDHSRAGGHYFRVPGTDENLSANENLRAIARYLQTLDQQQAPGVRALGV